MGKAFSRYSVRTWFNQDLKAAWRGSATMLPFCRAIDGVVRVAFLSATIPPDLEFCNLDLELPLLILAGDSNILGMVDAALRWVMGLIVEGYERAPVLVMVLSAVLIVPLAAVLSYVLSSLAYRLLDRTRASRVMASVPGADEPPSWPSQAWLDIEGHQRSALPSRATLVRIGRHQDNEIFIPDRSVHRHHAVIARTFDADYVITDMSGEGGNGVLINGERFLESRLFSGDVIQLGEARMRFESTLL
jgi:FHA domain